jgi:L-asparaginase
MGKPRTDARENIITALEIAIEQSKVENPLSEVAIYFNNNLLRGNRSRKLESELFNAFVSENYPPLATVGINIDYHKANFLEKPSKSFQLNYEMDPNIATIKLYPGITESVVKAIIQTPGLKAIIIESFGSGNLPSTPWLIALFEECVQKQLILYNISQCNGGKVLKGQYASSKNSNNLLVSGSDISSEAAITKLMWVLGQKLDYQTSINLLEANLAGELSST